METQRGSASRKEAQLCSEPSLLWFHSSVSASLHAPPPPQHLQLLLPPRTPSIPAPGRRQGPRKSSWEQKAAPSPAGEAPGARSLDASTSCRFSSKGELGLFPSCWGLAESDLQPTQVHINPLPLGTGRGPIIRQTPCHFVGFIHTNGKGACTGRRLAERAWEPSLEGLRLSRAKTMPFDVQGSCRRSAGGDAPWGGGG